MVKALHLISIFLITLQGFASSEEAKERGLSQIRPETGKSIVTFLADDLLEGREAGTRGGQLAAAFLASEMCRLNLIPFPFEQNDKAEYLQPFSAVTRRGDSLTLQNVVGYIRGKTDEWVVVGAHYDHLGAGEGDIFNGADDNASGVSAVLQIAAGFVASQTAPLRNILFALWDGEEKGLLGSAHFTNKEMQGMKVVAYMNFDMIGRDATDSAPGHVDYFYTESYPQFADWLKEHIQNYRLPLKPVYRAWDKPISGSDNASFARKGVPILWYHTNGHPDYHKVSDHSGKINWEKMYHITQSAYLTVWNLAHLEKPAEPLNK